MTSRQEATAHGAQSTLPHLAHHLADIGQTPPCVTASPSDQARHGTQDVVQGSKDDAALYREIFEQFAQGICITDARRRIVAVNPAFTAITGYSFADVSGRHPNILKAGRMSSTGMSSTEYRTMWQSVRNTGSWQGEVWISIKAGEEHPYLLTVSQVRNDRGTPTNYVAALSDLAQHKAAENQISFLAQHDELTGLPNRHLLHSRLAQALAAAHRHGGQVALLFLDLDRFKVINDSLGHRTGDLLLCSVATRLKSILREEDTVARLGGDEFVFIIPYVDRPDMPAHVAQKIIWALTEPHEIEGQDFSIGTSVGISLYPSDADDGEKLIRNADSAMYRAKSRGGNCYEFYTPNLTTRAVERMSLEHSLRRGLANHEFLTFYQPKVDLSTGRIAGAEALLRWSNPELGVVSPDRFIPVAEETGLIVAIGDWVLLDACMQNGQWQRYGLPSIPISVNISARQCTQELVSFVRRALLESKLEARYLELEITEGTLMTEGAAVLHELKSIGVQLSIDDFGKGYSSLSYLKRFPIDMLKIDRSFITDIEIHERDGAIANAVISLAHSLNLKVTAEGVQAAWQARYLRNRRCDWVQGYYFSRPVPANKFATMLRRGKMARPRPDC